MSLRLLVTLGALAGLFACGGDANRFGLDTHRVVAQRIYVGPEPRLTS